ncbi:MAG: hypothetical protein Q4F18_11175, partial [Clostridia bacterium]|nr:hypothetical protein [Clostridia bacterium]
NRPRSPSSGNLQRFSEGGKRSLAAEPPPGKKTLCAHAREPLKHCIWCMSARTSRYFAKHLPEGFQRGFLPPPHAAFFVSYETAKAEPAGMRPMDSASLYSFDYSSS